MRKNKRNILPEHMWASRYKSRWFGVETDEFGILVEVRGKRAIQIISYPISSKNIGGTQ